MYKFIFLTALFVAVSCRPQFRFAKPLAAGPGLRQPHFLNPAPLPVQNLEPEQIPLNLPPRKSPKPNLPQFPLERGAEPTEQEVYQNHNAQYQFSSNIEDHINDQTQQREEARDGLSVKGKYSYSDGYFKRTVEYIADENGYRVIGMEAVPLDGPHVDLMGTASVSNSAHGTELKYKVVSIPVEGPVGKIVDS